MYAAEVLVDKEVQFSAAGIFQLASICLVESVSGMLAAETKFDVIDAAAGSNPVCLNVRYDFIIDELQNNQINTNSLFVRPMKGLR